MFEFARIYIRSIIGIATVGLVTCYGMYLGAVTPDVQLAALAVIASCVLFDKPKPEMVE